MSSPQFRSIPIWKFRFNRENGNWKFSNDRDLSTKRNKNKSVSKDEEARKNREASLPGGMYWNENFDEGGRGRGTSEPCDGSRMSRGGTKWKLLSKMAGPVYRFHGIPTSYVPFSRTHFCTWAYARDTRLRDASAWTKIFFFSFANRASFEVRSFPRSIRSFVSPRLYIEFPGSENSSSNSLPSTPLPPSPLLVKVSLRFPPSAM